MITALESLRLRLRDPNIANRCKIAYNPSLVIVYFYIQFMYATTGLRDNLEVKATQFEGGNILA